jgi:hypothetical protein
VDWRAQLRGRDRERGCGGEARFLRRGPRPFPCHRYSHSRIQIFPVMPPGESTSISPPPRCRSGCPARDATRWSAAHDENGAPRKPDRPASSSRLPVGAPTRSRSHPGRRRGACKGGSPACSNFSVAGPYTEWLVLGAVATHDEGRPMWDNAKMEFSSSKDATKWIKPAYRKGLEVKL